MSFLLRIVLPDRPGMLGAVASELGKVGADIVSVDVVERTPGIAVDDLVVELAEGRLPDALISAAQTIKGVWVESIRRYAGSLATQRELELI
jgi:ACT domain-containing protein